MSTDSSADIFRRWGYLQADIDDFDRLPPFPHSELDSASGSDVDHWRSIYCGKIGTQFMHIPYPDRCNWIAAKMEGERPEPNRRRILKRILESEIFEKFLHTRYVGSKRFSLEGNNALIPLLDAIIDQAAAEGAENVLLAMQHRGRLNVMHHIAGTPAETIVAGFEDADPKSMLGSNDVKYHHGATGSYTTERGKDVYINLASNPSHLEAIGPVLMGRTRAKQQRFKDHDRRKIVAVIMHGDAAFAGQGIVAEALNYANINGFEIGGVVHIIINNMIGFTTVPEALHSTRFASEVATRIHAPIFHVNAESPDDVDFVGRIATEYRNAYASDVVIDLVGYRRFGHQEQDDPTLTSPVLYQKIKGHPLLYESYAQQIGIAQDNLAQLKQSTLDLLQVGLEKGRAMKDKPTWTKSANYWDYFEGGFYNSSLEVQTALSKDRLQEITRKVCTIPEGFTIHPKLKRVFDNRALMGKGERNVDWGMAEVLAFGSLLEDGVPVRLTGQDSRRGTFSHRHAVIHDYNTGKEYCPLEQLQGESAFFDIYDSMLSEAAAVGYEYGFSRDYPEALVCWEAQFGDFVNGAQVIIDQFLCAGEDKWSLLSGLTMLLPHGYEGAGPEHSSARLERFLQLCGEDNIQVAYPSSASQYFHLMRRQALRKWRKPLIVMTPKSMLRAPAASSPISEFTDGYFNRVINDSPEFINASRLLVCTGKIVHELRKGREENGDKDTAIITVEELYPLPEQELRACIRSYKSLQSIIWVQEEPANMGALFYIRPHLERLGNDVRVSTVRRSASASPATGSASAHSLEQQALIRLAFARTNQREVAHG